MIPRKVIKLVLACLSKKISINATVFDNKGDNDFFRDNHRKKKHVCSKLLVAN